MLLAYGALAITPDIVHVITFANIFSSIGWFIMHTLTTSEAKSNLYRLIDDAATNHEPVVITSKRHNAVLVSADDWASIQETVYFLSIPACVNQLGRVCRVQRKSVRRS